MNRRDNLVIWAYLATGATIILATGAVLIRLAGVA